MNIKDLKEIIKDLPDDMKIEIDTALDHVNNIDYEIDKKWNTLIFIEKE